MVSRRKIIRVGHFNIQWQQKEGLSIKEHAIHSKRELYHYDLIFAASVIIVYPGEIK
jgi:hypothetical protein